MYCEKVRDHIVAWIKERAEKANVKRLVVGVSGGIDSAVTSTLSALTGLPVTVINMPIHQDPTHVSRSDEQISWLKSKFDTVEGHTVDLTACFDAFANSLPIPLNDDLANANSRSRLRMVCLYAFANTQHGLVVGTGNKVEDYGVRFFTKYGDGGIDISPISDLTKSEVYELGRFLGVPQSILEAAPSDGLWNDGRTDEDQIGATYAELEWAMEYYDLHGLKMNGDRDSFPDRNFANELSSRQIEVLRIYADRHEKHAHKMEAPPTCEIPKEFKN